MKSADLSRLPRAAKAYINELETGLAERDARIDELNKRLDALEEQYRLALARQYAPKSEKRRDRVFNEAEEAAQTEPADEDELDFNGRGTAGLGPLSYEAQRGMYLHPTYAVTPERLPLGVLDVGARGEGRARQTWRLEGKPALDRGV